MRLSALRLYVTLRCAMTGALIPFLLAADRPNPAKLNDPSLRLVHTQHYDFHTDLDESLVADLSARMDVMYDQYVKTFREFKPPTSAPALPVYLFATHEKYLAFTDRSGINTGGLFVSGLHPYLTAYEQGQGHDALRRTLQHEAFHQFAHSTISNRLPPWMNEGMAQGFEESIWMGKDFVTDQIPPRRIRQLRADVLQKRLIEFDQFLAMSPADWKQILHSNIEKAGLCYNQAWAMTQFCSESGDKEYHARFLDFVKRLHENSDVTVATRACFPDLKEFRKRFNAWVAGLEPTPEATMMERQEVLADFLMTVTQKDHPVPKDMAGFCRLAVQYNIKIRYTRNNLTYSTAENPLIYFSGVSGPVFKASELFFQDNPQGPLPDIICQPAGAHYRYRTHFYLSEGETTHELLIEPSDER